MVCVCVCVRAHLPIYAIYIQKKCSQAITVVIVTNSNQQLTHMVMGRFLGTVYGPVPGYPNIAGYKMNGNSAGLACHIGSDQHIHRSVGSHISPRNWLL